MKVGSFGRLFIFLIYYIIHIVKNPIFIAIVKPAASEALTCSSRRNARIRHGRIPDFYSSALGQQHSSCIKCGKI